MKPGNRLLVVFASLALSWSSSPCFAQRRSAAGLSGASAHSDIGTVACDAGDAGPWRRRRTDADAAPRRAAGPSRRLVSAGSPSADGWRDRRPASAAAGTRRLALSDQPGHRLAAGRRATAGDRRRASERLGRRGPASKREDSLDPHAEPRLRLYPPRWLWAGHAQRPERSRGAKRLRPIRSFFVGQAA